MSCPCEAAEVVMRMRGEDSPADRRKRKEYSLKTNVFGTAHLQTLFF